MGILIQFPQPGTRKQSGTPATTESEAHEVRLAAAYQRDLDRAVGLLLEHIDSGAYDGVALILKPATVTSKPAFVVGGFYRHRLAEAADAAMQLHLAISLRAREQALERQVCETRTATLHTPETALGSLDKEMQATLQEKWNDATARYHRCEQMLRIAFSRQLQASPETTSILLSITQLHIETVANCLWELMRQPGRASPQTKLETLNAIQLFRTARAQVSAWMPPPGQEAAYFAANAIALTEEMLREGDLLLSHAEEALIKIGGAVCSTKSAGM